MAKCTLCGEPMPEGESMFKFHGYSGPCPKPPLEQTLVAVQVGIRRRGDDYFVFMDGQEEIACSSLQEAKRALDDLNAMVKQLGGDIMPAKSN